MRVGLLLLGLFISMSIHSQKSGDFFPDLEPITADNMQEITQVGMLGTGIAGEVAWSPDGAELAVATSVGVWIYDPLNWDEPPEFIDAPTGFWGWAGGQIWIPSIQYSPDNRYLVYGGNRILDRTTNQTIVNLPDGALVFHPDQDQLIIGAETHLYFYDLPSFELQRQWELPDEFNNPDYPTYVWHDITLSPARNMLISVDSLGHLVAFWDITQLSADDALLHSIYDENIQLIDVELMPDDNFVAGMPGGLRLWNLDTFEPSDALRQVYAISVAFSPDGTLMAAGQSGIRHPVGYFGPTTVTLYDLKANETVFTWEGHNEVENLSFSPDGRLLAASSRVDGAVRILDVESQRTIMELGGSYDAAHIHLNADGSLLAVQPVYGFGGIVSVIDLASGTNLCQFEGWGGTVLSDVVFTPENDVILATPIDAEFTIFDITNNEEISHLSGYDGYIAETVWSPNLDRIATAHPSSQSVYVWETHTGTLVSEYHFPIDFWNDKLRFSSDSTQLMAISQNGAVHVWDSETGDNIQVFDQSARSLALSNDGTLLAISTGNNRLIVLEVASGNVVFELPGTKIWLQSQPEKDEIAFLDDGRRLIFSALEQGLMMLDLTTGTTEPLIELEELDPDIVTPDEQNVVEDTLIAEGETLLLLNNTNVFSVIPLTSANRVVLCCHSGRSYDAVFHPNGRLIITSGAEGVIRLWGVPAR